MATSKTDAVKHGSGRKELGVNIRYASFAITAAIAGAAADVIEMLNVWAGEVVTDVKLISTDIDTNGTPTVVLDVGDGVDDNYYIDGSTVGQGGGVEYSNVVTAVPKAYTANDTLDITVQAAAATAAAGTVTLVATITS